eukprot:15355579-Ditylum_brightwellii.AAC.1
MLLHQRKLGAKFAMYSWNAAPVDGVDIKRAMVAIGRPATNARRRRRPPRNRALCSLLPIAPKAAGGVQAAWSMTGTKGIVTSRTRGKPRRHSSPKTWWSSGDKASQIQQ